MPGWVWVFLIAAGALFVVKLFYVVTAGGLLSVTRGAIFVSTARIRIRAFLDAVPMDKGDIFVDLGSGDGRILWAVHKRYGVRATGYEVNPLAYAIARLLCVGNKDLLVRYADFWKADLATADVVFCYLFPDVMGSLASKLEKELKPGTRVVSCNFALPGWSPERILRPDSLRHGDPIYVYRYSPDHEE
jgi:hypothetical protein